MTLTKWLVTQTRNTYQRVSGSKAHHPTEPGVSRLPKPGTPGGRFGRFTSDRRGSVIVELAFAVPIGIVIIVGCFDAARLVMLHQKVDRASSAMADLVAQPETFDPDSDLTSLYSAATRLVEPFDLATNGLVIVSEIAGQPDESGLITWQRSGAGSYSASSSIGSQGSTATLPASFTSVREGETLVVTEVFYDYEPLFLNYVLEAQVIEHQSYRRPRQR